MTDLRTNIIIGARDETDRATRSVRKNVDGISDQLKRAKQQLIAFFGAAAIAHGAGQIIQTADNYTLMNSRLKLATESQIAYSRAQEQTFRLAQETRQQLGSTVNLYARMARSTKDLADVTQNDLLTVTRAINQSFIVSGAAAQEANAAVIQLSQGMASGALRGDELRSVMEQAPRLFEALAAGMGITRGELRELAEQGEITTEKIITALKSQADVIDREFGQMQMTVDQAWQQIGNAVTLYIGQTNQGIGATDALADSISELAMNFEAVGDTVLLTGGTIAAVFTGKAINAIGNYAAKQVVAAQAATTMRQSSLAAAQAEAAHTATIHANTQATVAAARARVASARNIRQQLIAQKALHQWEYAALNATAANTAAQNRLAAAQVAASRSARAGAIASRALSGALGLLGGPGGIALLAAGGLYLLAQREDQVEQSARLATEAQREFNDALQEGAENADEFGRKAIEAVERNIAAIEAEIASLAALNVGAMAGISAGDIGGLGERLEDARFRVFALRRAMIEADADMTAFGNSAEDAAQRSKKFGDVQKENADWLQDLKEELGESIRLHGLEGAALEKAKVGHELMARASEMEAAGLRQAANEMRGQAEEIFALIDHKYKLVDATEAQAAAERRLNADIEKLLQNQALFATGWEDRDVRLGNQIGSLERELETDLEALNRWRDERIQLLEDARDAELPILHGYNEARERIDEEYYRRRKEMAERNVGELTRIYNAGIRDISTGVGQMVADELIREGQAKDRAKRDLQERLADLQEQLDEGTISKADALEERERLYEDYRDRIEEIDQSIGDRMEEILVDSLASAIEKMTAQLLESGLGELFASLFDDQPGISFGGFSFGSAFGSDDGNSTGGTVANTVVSQAAKKVAQEYFPQIFGGSESGAGGGGWAAGTGGAAQQSAAQLTGNAQVAQSGFHAGTGAAATTATAAQLTGNAQVAASGLHVGTGAGAGGGSAAGGGTAAGFGPAAVLAIPLVAAYLDGHFKTTAGDIAHSVFKRGLGATGAPLGLQYAQEQNKLFAAGDNVGFATDYARRQGLGAWTAERSQPGGLANLGTGGDIEQFMNVLRGAEEEFEQIKTAGAEAFGEIGETADSIGALIQDGLIEPTELAERGIIKMGQAYTHPETGAMKLKAMTVEQFRAITAAIRSGEVRLSALRGITQLTAEEQEVLGEIGVTAASDIATGFNAAEGSIRQFGQQVRDQMGDAEGAVRSLASAISEIPSAPSSRSHGGSSSESSSGGNSPHHPGLAEGGIVSSRGVYELSEYNHPELVVPLSRGRAVPVEMRGGGNSGNAENTALLRRIEARLARLDDLSTRIDDRSVAALASAVAGPIAGAVDRQTWHQDNQDRQF